MQLEQRITELLAPALEAEGYTLVRVRLQDGGGQKLLQVMVEHADGRGVNVDECADVSYTVSALLDVEDPISSNYRLEVGSPGMDRPLVTRKDFERFAGREAKLEMKLPQGLEGRRRFSGVLGGLEGEQIVLQMGEEKILLPLEQVKEARLVVTEQMLQEAKRRAKRASETT